MQFQVYKYYDYLNHNISDEIIDESAIISTKLDFHKS
jgi:hypothetical protein